jgi:hypothetical protein
LEIVVLLISISSVPGVRQVRLTVANQGKLPTNDAAAVAQAPYHRVPIPYALILSRKICTPSDPCVCIVVLSVSRGTRIIRNPAAARDANAVLTGDGSLFKKGLLERRARIPAFAAVSPNLATIKPHQYAPKDEERERTDRTLEQSWSQSSVISSISSFRVQLGNSDERSPTISILITTISAPSDPPRMRKGWYSLHDRPQRHQRKNLYDHRHSSSKSLHPHIISIRLPLSPQMDWTHPTSRLLQRAFPIKLPSSFPHSLHEQHPHKHTKPHPLPTNISTRTSEGEREGRTKASHFQVDELSFLSDSAASNAAAV